MNPRILTTAVCLLTFLPSYGRAESTRIHGDCDLTLINVHAWSVMVTGNCSSRTEFERMAQSLNTLHAEGKFNLDELRRIIQATNIITVELHRASGNTAELKKKLSHVEHILGDLHSGSPKTATSGKVISLNNQAPSVNIGLNSGTVNQTFTIEREPNHYVPLDDSTLPPISTEAEFLRNFLQQMQGQVRSTHHIRLSTVFGRLYDSIPGYPVNWVEALEELARQGRVNNIIPVSEPWFYNGIGGSQRFSSDFYFDIANVAK